jgi:hypothetical protein
MIFHHDYEDVIEMRNALRNRTFLREHRTRKGSGEQAHHYHLFHGLLVLSSCEIFSTDRAYQAALNRGGLCVRHIKEGLRFEQKSPQQFTAQPNVPPDFLTRRVRICSEQIPLGRIVGLSECAVKRRWSSAGEKSRPGAGSFRPVAIEAAAEATKLLKPSV